MQTLLFLRGDRLPNALFKHLQLFEVRHQNPEDCLAGVEIGDELVESVKLALLGPHFVGNRTVILARELGEAW